LTTACIGTNDISTSKVNYLMKTRLNDVLTSQTKLS
jgi:hypothetical protein